jgi:ADP-ribosylglycohydrolase
MADSHEERLKRAYLSLDGLSIADACGDRYFLHDDIAISMIRERALPSPPWRWTDDTNMALSIVAMLRQEKRIDQDRLALSFARHYHPGRGYGAGAGMLLRQIGLGMKWQVAARNLFAGMGSYGNGAAMRVAPLGGYYADDIELVIQQARLSAEVTHTHPEGIAGAIAIAVAAAYAGNLRGKAKPTRREFLDMILPHILDSEVREKIRHARDLAPGSSIELAMAALGTGYAISAQDTVPYTLWCAGEYLDNYEEAFWQTLSGLGDRDTTCAIVGGIVALYTGHEGIPEVWKQSREPLPEWIFSDDT